MAGSSFKLGKIAYSKNDITSAGGTTILTNSSDYYQYVTGSTTQTIQLPDATTMVVGLGFVVINANSAGIVTVTNNGGSTIASLSPGQSTKFIADNISTSNGVWMTLKGVSSAGVTWTDITGTSQTLAANNGYIADNASIVTFTLPATSAVGDIYYIVGRGAGGWQLKQNSGQTIYDNTSNSTTGISGGIASGDNRACVTVVCVSASTEFEVTNYNGTVNIVSFKVFGYAAGGNTSRQEVDTITYSNDTITNVGNVLSYAVDSSSSNTYSSSKGYLMGGNTSGNTSAIQSLVFSNNTSATLSATLSNSRDDTSGGGYSSIKAYQCGGYLSGTTNTNVIDALTFSGETRATLGATLSGNYNLIGAAQNGTTKIYLAGGQAGSGTSASNGIQALTISGEATSTISATLSQAIQGTNGVYSSTKGYFLGGYQYSIGPISFINVLTFSGETTTTLGSSLAGPLDQAAASSSSTKGYAAAGYNGSSALSSVYAITFAGETLATLSGTVGNARYNPSGF